MPLTARRFWVGMLLALLLAAPLSARAQEKTAPLFPPPSAEPAPTAQPAGAPSLVRQAVGLVVRTEARLSRELNRQLGAIRRGEGWGALLAGIFAAFLYGVFHTLAVGHGKTVVVGYFLGNRARPLQGVAMATWIAVSHVVAAIVVAVATHWILERALMSPVEQNHWIRMISFGAIALIGAWMLVGAWRGTGHCHHHHHDHDHDHHHDHDRHHHGGGVGHRRLLALAAGFVPCSGAILILTFAIANGILASGLAMVGAIAVGMALTLAGLGLASMLLHHQVAVRFAGGGRASRWLGLLGPLLILLIGGLLFLAEVSILVIAPSN